MKQASRQPAARRNLQDRAVFLDETRTPHSRAIWSMEDYLILAEGGNRPASQHGYGHYHEIWRDVDGSWRIAEIDLYRTILHTEPRGASAPLNDLR